MCINIATWKRVLFDAYLSKEYDNIIYIPLKNDIFDYTSILDKSNKCSVLVWGYRECKNFNRFVENFRVTVIRVEDGFIRSKGLGIDHEIPYSLCFDKNGLYYNAKCRSDFEILVENRQNYLTDDVLNLARHYRKLFIKRHITKYNVIDSENSFKYPAKTRERILVVGQTESDFSILYSESKIVKNIDLIHFVKSVNPNAEIVYKQHPDDIRNQVSLNNIKSLCDIIVNSNVLIDDILIGVDKVYTISSLFGLEALIRGFNVYTTGLPFYAGWGLTNDSISSTRRTARLSIDELFALSYLIYPKYFDKSFNQISAKDFLDSFIGEDSNEVDLNEALKDQHLEKSNNTDKQKEINMTNSATQSIDGDNLFKSIQSYNKKELPKYIESYNKKELPKYIESYNKKELPKYIESYNKKELPKYVESYNENQFPKSFDLYYKRALTSKIDSYIDLESDVKFLNSCRESCFVNIIFCNKEKQFDYNLIKIKDFTFVNLTLPFFDYSHFLLACKNDLVRYHNIVRSLLLNIRKFIRGFVLCDVKDIAHTEFTWVCRELNIPVIYIDIFNSILIDNDFDIYSKYIDFVIVSNNEAKELVVNHGFDSKKVSSANLSSFMTCKYKNNDDQPLVSKEEFFAIHNLETFYKTIALYIDNNDKYNLDLKAKVKEIVSLCANNSYQLIIIDEQNLLSLINLDKFFISYDNSSVLKTCVYDTFYYSKLVICLSVSKIINHYKNKFSNIVCYSSTMSYRSSIKFIGDLSIINDLVDDNSSALNSTISDSELNIEQNSNLTEVLSNFEQDFLKQRCGTYNYSEVNYILSESILPNTIGTIIDHSKSLEGNTKYYPSLLQLFELKTYDMIDSIEDFFNTDFVFQYELKTNSTKRNFKHMIGKLWRPRLIVGDGFLRSVGLGVLGSSALGVTLDARTSYYDSTQPSTMETILNSDFTITEEQLLYCKETIEYIVNNKISKYNHAPDFYLKLGNHERKILIVDQRYGDMSVEKGAGDSSLFSKMLDDALSIEDCDVIVKQHPDSISGGKQSYMSNDILDIVKGYSSNLYVVNYDINPYSLMKYITDVYVCSSGLGFEALMAGKNVKCYGIPFYSGWGVTEDLQKCSRRQKVRSLEEIFYVAYVLCSRYYIPNSETVCGPLEMAKYLKLQRDLI
jgi:capsule polysaccharide export protein KpsC/LpsZ